jgi:hypothetical protein
VLLWGGILKISGIIRAVSSNNGGVKRQIDNPNNPTTIQPNPTIIPPRRVRVFQDPAKDAKNIINMVALSTLTLLEILSGSAKSRKKQSGGAFGMPSYAGKFVKLGQKYGGRKKKAGGTKQSGGGMGNLTRQTPRKQLNNVPTQFQYHQ